VKCKSESYDAVVSRQVKAPKYGHFVAIERICRKKKAPVQANRGFRMFYLIEEVHCKVRYSCAVESGNQSLSLSDARGRRRGISELFCYRGSTIVASN
jgi:hypothetical protein